MKRLLLAVAGIAAAAACTNVFAPLAPGPYLNGDAEPLIFTVAVSKSTVRVGDTASLIVTLRNPTNKRVTLRFSTGCQVVTRVRRGRAEVWPQPYTCTLAQSSMIIEGFMEHVERVPFTAISGEELAIYTGLVLTPASYVAFAELENEQGRSTSVDFTIVR